MKISNDNKIAYLLRTPYLMGITERTGKKAIKLHKINTKLLHRQTAENIQIDIAPNNR